MTLDPEMRNILSIYFSPLPPRTFSYNSFTINQWLIKQSNDQSINQSINQPTKLINQSINQSI